MDEYGEITTNTSTEVSKSLEEVSTAQTSPDIVESFEAIDTNQTQPPHTLNPTMNGQIRTLNGEIAGDEFAADAINYQILLGKIDTLLERLKLDA